MDEQVTLSCFIYFSLNHSSDNSSFISGLGQFV